MSDNFNKNRILTNTLLLYVRMLFTMWLNLYATRLTLANLGIEDMGVYGVIGSIVSLFTVFTNGITTAVQRFITFELGLKNGEPNKVFCSSLNVILILSGIMVIFMEVVGLWMLQYKINIPESSRDASFWVFQLSVLTCIVNTISIPYNALIIAYEKMNAFAIISIVQVVLNFMAAYCISIFEEQKLLMYAILLAISSVLVRLIYQLYCHNKFSEATYHFEIDWNRMRQIGKFTSVTTTSGVLQIISSQGIVFVINLTLGVAINAVYSIALQLKNSILSFALNVQRAISPQITKTYANNELSLYKKLIYGGTKLEIYLIFLIIIPFLFRTNEILLLWLGNVPNHMVLYAQCFVLISLIYAAIGPMQTAVFATNKIVNYLIIPECFSILILPVVYLSGKCFSNPGIIAFIILIMNVIVCIMKLFYAYKAVEIPLILILKNILLPCIWVGISSLFCCYILVHFLDNDIVGILELYLFNSIILFLIILLVGLTRKERLQLIKILSPLKEKIFSKN